MSEIDIRATVDSWLRTSAATLARAADDLLDATVASAQALAEAIGAGNKVLVCGNGGSAADAQHFAAELVGRFLRERGPLPAIALTTDTSALTAIANDYGYEAVFERQVRALGARGDVLLALSTSGTSPNVIAAVRTARELGMATVALTGAEGGRLASECDHALRAPATGTGHVQEVHIALLHAICAAVDEVPRG